MITIEQLKQELREFIELSKTVTRGKWEQHKAPHLNRGGDGPTSIVFQCHYRNDASFIARARNISPAMAECLLAAVEGLERVSETRELVEHGDDNGNGPYVSSFRTSHALFTEEKLQQILNIWEAGK